MAVALKRQTTMDAEAGIRELFEQHHEAVIQSAYRITGRAEDAEDVLQTVFVRLLNRGEPPVLGEGSRSYLRRAAINAALDIVRSRRQRQRIPLESVGEKLIDRLSGDGETYRRNRELRDWFRAAVSRLNPKAAEVFILRFVEGYSNQQIAEILGTTPGTIAVTLHRTRMKLQEDFTLGGVHHE